MGTYPNDPSGSAFAVRYSYEDNGLLAAASVVSATTPPEGDEVWRATPVEVRGRQVAREVAGHHETADLEERTPGMEQPTPSPIDDLWTRCAALSKSC